MSSILKALKKLDTQKRAADEQGPALSRSQELPAPQRLWLLLVAGGVLGALFVGVLIVWLETPAPVLQEPGKASLATVATEVLTKAVVPVATQSDTVSSPSSAERQPLPVSLASPNLSPGNLSSAVPPPKTVQPNTAPSPTENSPFSQTKPVEVAKSEPISTVAKGVPPAGVAEHPSAAAVDTQELTAPNIVLKVTDIYFQDGSTDNMAVVNDLPVMEGTQIEEVVVLKILVDRVVFLIDDQRFEILSSSTGQ